MVREAYLVSLIDDIVDRAVSVTGLDDASEALGKALTVGVERVESQSSDAAARSEGLADRVAIDVLRQRVLTLSEQNGALEKAVERLADESQALQDEVWDWRQRVQRLRAAAGCSTAPESRPEPALTIGLGGSGKAGWSPADRLLAGLQRQEVRVAASTPLWERAEALIQRRGWDQEWQDDAIVFILALGLDRLEQQATGDGSRAAPRETDLAALNARHFSLHESLRILGLRETALRIDNHGMRIRLDQLKSEARKLEEARETQAGGRKATGEREGLLARLLRWRGQRPGRPGSGDQ
jgi:hypothetical protein